MKGSTTGTSGGLQKNRGKKHRSDAKNSEIDQSRRPNRHQLEEHRFLNRNKSAGNGRRKTVAKVGEEGEREEAQGTHSEKGTKRHQRSGTNENDDSLT